jgi:hypothetical protein
VGDQDIGSPGRPVSSGLQVPGETFPSWSGKGLISTPVVTQFGKLNKVLRPTYFLFNCVSVQGKGGSLTVPDPENRVGDQDIGSKGRPVSSGLQVPGEPFPSRSG